MAREKKCGQEDCVMSVFQLESKTGLIETLKPELFLLLSKI